MTWLAMVAQVALVAQGGVEAQAGQADAGDAAAEALASLAWEPDCASTVQAALEASGGALAGKKPLGRARLAALLPLVRFTVEKSLGQDKQLDQDGEGSLDITLDSADDLKIRGYLEWDLSGLVFAPAEPSVAARLQDEAEWRVDLAGQVVAAFHERKKLKVLLSIGAVTDPASVVEVELRVAEMTALLDALTGGWYSAELAGVEATSASAW